MLRLPPQTSKGASRSASNAGLDEFYPTRWRVIAEYQAT